MRRRLASVLPLLLATAGFLLAAAARTSGPVVEKAGDLGVGRMLADLPFNDLSGQTHHLAEVSGGKGLVIAMTSSTCPISRRYLPSLRALEQTLAGQGLRLLVVNAMAGESTEDIRAQIKEAGLTSLYCHDREAGLSAVLGARTTAEVFLLDARRTLRYRGALDDQYGTDYSREQPTRRYLADAITAMRAERPLTVAATTAPGCELDLKPAVGPATAITYHRDVARILQQHCVRCHHAQGIAPFPLDDLASVKDHTKTIRRVLQEGTMPPWFAAPPKDGGPSPFANDCSLGARDKADLLAWIDSKDRPPGDTAEAPAKLLFDGEWTIGKPDAIIPLSKAYPIKATGVMPYQTDVVSTEFAEDKWVKAYEIIPSVREVVHHVIVMVHPPGEKIKGGGAENYWAIYVPGNSARVFDDGIARKLPAGSRISFQIHYTPNGKPVEERMRLGLIFAAEPPRLEIKTVGVAKLLLSIPPFEAHHVETKTQKVPTDLTVTILLAHMHVRGKAFKYELIHPDGREELLLDIPRYDFNWQLRYDFKQPKTFPKGSSLRITAVFDNSSGNQANPDPSKTVKWGPQTSDEMMIGYLEYVVPAGKH
jgi:mono/diheme cytochrome c family protein